jgi:small-conductance mechanosensitive channel
LLGQLGLIALAAVIATVAAALTRRRVDLNALTLGWPQFLQTVARLLLANLGSIIFVLIVAIMQAATVSLDFQGRFDLLSVAASLATAWVVIALVAGLIRNQFVYRLVAASAWTIAALSILGLLQPTMTALDSFAIVIGGLRVTPLLVIKTSVLLMLTLWAANTASDFLDRRVQSSADLTPSIQVLIGKLIRLLLITFAILIALSTVGIDFSALALFSGAVGVGLGFGLQKIVSNLVSGIILLADKSIKPGDVISVGDSFGWVGSMGARYTSIVTREGRDSQRGLRYPTGDQLVLFQRRGAPRRSVWRFLCERSAQDLPDRHGSDEDGGARADLAGAGLPSQGLRQLLARFHAALLDPRPGGRRHQCARAGLAGAVGCLQARGDRDSLSGARRAHHAGGRRDRR